MIDGHMHLEYGDLSVDYVLEFVNAAKECGLTTIQILDHTHRFIEFAPIYDELKIAAQQQKEWLEKKKLEPLSKYHKLIEDVKRMDLDIEVRFGLEVCYTPNSEEFIRNILAQYKYDFIIGSIHSIDGLLYDMSSFSKEILWNVYDANHIYKRYYEILEQLISSDLFTQVGHPDTIKMFNIYPTYDLTPTYHKIAELMKKHHVKAENNTGCYFRYNHKDMGLSSEFLEILKEHDVEIIPCSDGHYPNQIGKGIKEVSNL